MRADRYQFILIAFGLIVTGLLGIFVYFEMFPEYKKYQDAYVQLEEFRAELINQPAPPFKRGVKQLMLPRTDTGPETIDRCISCHVAMKFSHFSETKVATDINGEPVLDEGGHPVLVPNEDYVFKQLEDKIAELKAEGKDAGHLEQLLTVQVGDNTYDMKKVLAAHPLMGKELRPFESHSMEQFGCVSCHSGNGRGLVTDRAHGPVFDGTYKPAPHGPEPKFLEEDPKNDPLFAKMYNDKPGHRLLFQTTPLLVGPVMQAKCVQCHQSDANRVEGVVDAFDRIGEDDTRAQSVIAGALERDKEALEALLSTKRTVADRGIQFAVDQLRAELGNLRLADVDRARIKGQISYLGSLGDDRVAVIDDLNREIQRLVGSDKVREVLEQMLVKKVSASKLEVIDEVLNDFRQDEAARSGAIFAKLDTLDVARKQATNFERFHGPLDLWKRGQKGEALASDVDRMTQNYQRGRELFTSQACYACHRITGLSRGGVGPELTEEGLYYPWFVKESIVWPQADVPSSQMPNYKLDHEEVQDLFTFLMAQRGANEVISEVDRRVQTKAWEAGERTPIEKEISSVSMQDVREAMVTFAVEGCAACHRLKGYESNVGFMVERQQPSFNELFAEREWFRGLFDEEIAGSEIVAALEKHKDEIDRRIVRDVRTNGLLEEIDAKVPNTVESFYAPFKFAARAKNASYEKEELAEWQERVQRVMMIYVQEYGLGRLIGPRPNWAGIYRTEEWLMEHFRNPAGHIPKSLMPVMPFDDSKFFALTNMLVHVGRVNRDAVREVWDNKGFSPEMAYQEHCAICHGKYFKGNGPVSEWIYPIPKNLRWANFLRNLTKERAIISIVEGVRGTPMAPWGVVATGRKEAPVMTRREITQLVDWLFLSLPGARVIPGEEQVPKWDYEAEDVLKELEDEGGGLRSLNAPEMDEEQRLGILESVLGIKQDYLCSLDPLVAVMENKEKGFSVEDVFDVKPHPVPGGPEKKAYYIKERFFTDQNLADGERLFVLNCAQCHGKEGAGNGARATSMNEAKPRMLTNLDWLHTRDDLRMLRSIKYGVQGTSMSAWGALTNTLQRMQMVMYIRMLSKDKELRDSLASKLYGAFERARWSIQQARTLPQSKIETLQQQLTELLVERQELNRRAIEGKLGPDRIAELLQYQLGLEKSIHDAKQVDGTLEKLIAAVLEENACYNTVGQTFIQRDATGELFEKFLKLIDLNTERYAVRENRLNMSLPQEQAQTLNAITEEIVAMFDKEKESTRQKRVIEEARLPSKERAERLAAFDFRLNSIDKMKGTLLARMEEIFQLRREQSQLFEQYTQNKERLTRR